MIQYYSTLLVWAFILFVFLALLLKEPKYKNILSFISFFTLLNYLRIFPYFVIGHMNWTGNILLVIAAGVYFIFLKKENKYISLYEQLKSKTTLIILGIYLAFIVFVVLVIKPFETKSLEFFLLLATIAGFSEELQFRYCINSFLEKQVTDKKLKMFCIAIPYSLIITSFSFATVHMFFFRDSFSFVIFEFVSTFIVGVLLQMIYNKSKNILLSTCVHNMLNIVYRICL